MGRRLRWDSPIRQEDGSASASLEKRKWAVGGTSPLFKGISLHKRCTGLGSLQETVFPCETVEEELYISTAGYTVAYA